jgi:hypothetical protein
LNAEGSPPSTILWIWTFNPTCLVNIKLHSWTYKRKGYIHKYINTNIHTYICSFVPPISLSYCNICVTCGMFNMYNQWHRQVAGKNSQRNSANFLRLADVSRGWIVSKLSFQEPFLLSSSVSDDKTTESLKLLTYKY